MVSHRESLVGLFHFLRSLQYPSLSDTSRFYWFIKIETQGVNPRGLAFHCAAAMASVTQASYQIRRAEKSLQHSMIVMQGETIAQWNQVGLAVCHPNFYRGYIISRPADIGRCVTQHLPMQKGVLYCSWPDIDPRISL